MQRALHADAVGRASAIVPVEGKGLVFERGGRRIVDGIDIVLGATDATLAIIGPNGAGKSVLLRLLVGLLSPDAGSVTWAGTRPGRDRIHKVGFVFQKPVLLRRSALANVKYALRTSGCPSAERGRLALSALKEARLDHLAGSPARVLSGGEQQRLSIARALVTRPEMLILDEPTSNLDPASSAAIESVLRDVRADGTRIVLVTHDLGQARRIAEEVVFLHRGRILERAPAATFFAAPRTSAARAFLSGDLVL